MSLQVLSGSIFYGANAYTDYSNEEMLKEAENIQPVGSQKIRLQKKAWILFGLFDIIYVQKSISYLPWNLKFLTGENPNCHQVRIPVESDDFHFCLSDLHTNLINDGLSYR